MKLEPQVDVRQCRRCGVDFVYRVNVRVAYCSRYCYRRTNQWAYHNQRHSSELRDLLLDRRCAECGGEMSTDLNTNARYCGLPCKRAANAAQMREKRRMARTPC